MTSNHSSGHPEGHATTNQVDGQQDLFSQVDDTPDSELTISERFERFHRNNPHVYDTLVRLARRFISATGKRKLGAQRLIEIARWDMEIATKGEEEFEINNTYRAFYARLIMHQEPDLSGVFDLRSAPEADRWIAIIRHYGNGRAA